MAKGFQPPKHKLAKHKSEAYVWPPEQLALEDPKAQILTMCLQAAVPMEIMKVWHELCSGVSLDHLIEWERQHNVLEEQEAAFFVVGAPDQWKGKTGTYLKSPKPGIGAQVFARLARHLAVMSFVHPVSFLGARYWAEDYIVCEIRSDRNG